MTSPPLALRVTAAALGITAACSGGGAEVPRLLARAHDGASSRPTLPLTHDAGLRAPRDAMSEGDQRTDVAITAVWARPPAALLRSPGRNSCDAPRPPAIRVAPAAVIPDRYATERMIGLGGAAVFIDGAGRSARAAEPALAEVTIRRCVLSPPVVRLTGAGAPLVIINADERRHTVRVDHLDLTTNDVSPIATVSLPVLGSRVAIPIERAGIIRVASLADPRDAAYAVLAPGSTVAIADESGVARFTGVPPGPHRVRAWFPPPAPGEPSATGARTITVSDGGSTRARLQVAP